jgi:NAD(P)-dependent dehydrogenase (short-subunit alcohol dehydrogenase family)
MDMWIEQDIPSLAGRTVVVTGASSGLGLITARQLAARDAAVIMAVRDLAKGERARADLLAAVPRANVELRELDLLDLESVRRFTDRLRVERRGIDVLINNAAISDVPYQLSPQGYESQFATNHLGHFALTMELLPTLAEGTDPRVVTVASDLHRIGRLNLADPAATRGYSAGRAYADSKLANVLFGLELDRRLRAVGSPVRSLLAHPGMAATPMHHDNRTLGPRLFTALFGWLLTRPAADGALPILYAATAPDLPGGMYAGPQRLLGPMRPGPVRLGRRAHDTELADRLWTVSEQLVGTRYPVAR